MDISKILTDLKQDPLFKEKVGMILVHNGVVRNWSKQTKGQIRKLKVTPNYEKIHDLTAEFENKPGIFKIIVQANTGTFEPGDDLLFIVVAGDVRENVKPVLSEILERIKTEAIQKEEFTV